MAYRAVTDWVITLLLLVAMCSACSEGQPIETTADFQSASLKITSEQCMECFRYLTVEAPHNLRLEDSDGENVFSLTRDEFDDVRDMTMEDAFQKAIIHPKQWTCSSAADIGVEVELWRKDGSIDRARLSDSCFGRCDEPQHPFMRLKWRLFELKESYLRCAPAFCRYPEYCASAREPPPIWRTLCQLCVDECGVPIPEGAPTRDEPSHWDDPRCSEP